MEKIRRSFDFLNCINVAGNSSKGGLCLAWKVTTSVFVRSFSSNHINVKVEGNEKDVIWRLIGFNGSPYGQDKMVSWDLLRSLG